MHAKIIAIGTSKGIRLPKHLIQKYGFESIIEIDETDSGILLKPAKHSREGWAKQFAKYINENELIGFPDSDWDKDNWEW